MRKRRKATIATLASLATAMVVTVAGAGVTNTPFNPQVSGIGQAGVLGGVAGGSHQIIYDNPNGTAGYWDWNTPGYSWGDDVHFKDNNSAGWVITALNYGYFNTGAGGNTLTHTIIIYDMVPPSGTHGFSSVGGGFQSVPDLGAALGTIVLQGLQGTGAQSVVITGLSITVGHAAWISFDESIGNGGRTFWLSGGTPTTGASHDTLGAFDTSIGLYLQYPHPLTFAGYTGNIAMTISGYKVPGPSVIALLGLSGLVTLSRRRRK